MTRISASRHFAQRPRYIAPTTDTFTVEGDVEIDWVAVARVINNELPEPELNAAEKREAALALVRTGVPRRTVSTRLALYERLIKEWEAQAGLLPEKDICVHADCRHAVSGRRLCIDHLRLLRAAERAVKTAAQAPVALAA